MAIARWSPGMVLFEFLVLGPAGWVVSAGPGGSAEPVEGVGELGGPGPVLIGVQDDAAAGGAEAGGEVQDAGGCSGLRGT